MTHPLKREKYALADGTDSQSCSKEQRIQSREALEDQEAQDGQGTEREVDKPPGDDMGCTGVRSVRSDYRFGTK